MKLVPLHERFLAEVHEDLPEWKFIASRRHYRKNLPGKNLLVHVSFINHDRDFDATLDVSVEFLIDKKRSCVIGASLGNIEGSDQVRYSVASELSAVSAAHEAVAHLKRIGFPFLERYASAPAVLAALKAGGAEAQLISPLIQFHAQQISALESITSAGSQETHSR